MTFNQDSIFMLFNRSVGLLALGPSVRGNVGIAQLPGSSEVGVSMWVEDVGIRLAGSLGC